jgi:hypothetical protein
MKERTLSIFDCLVSASEDRCARFVGGIIDLTIDQSEKDNLKVQPLDRR